MSAETQNQTPQGPCVGACRFNCIGFLNCMILLGAVVENEVSLIRALYHGDPSSVAIDGLPCL